MAEFEETMNKHGFESTLRDVYYRRIGDRHVGYIAKIHFAYSGDPEVFSWNLNVLQDDGRTEAPIRHGRTANPASAVRQLLIAAGQPLPDPVTGMSVNDHVYEEVMNEVIRIGGWFRDDADVYDYEKRYFSRIQEDSVDRVDNHVRRDIATHRNAGEITAKAVAATEAFWKYLADVLEESGTFREGLTMRIQTAMASTKYSST